HSQLFTRTLQIGACGTALLLCTTPGSGEPASAKNKDTTKGKAACTAAFKSAVQLEQTNKLHQAKNMLLTCAKATCDALLRQRCTSHYTQLESDIPSVVPLVTDDAGSPRVDVQVT